VKIKSIGAVVGMAIVGGGIAPATASAQQPALDGAFSMQFRTTYNVGFAAPKVGSQWTREWIFGHSNGKLYVWRETATDGYQRLRVRRSGPVYTVKWNLRVRCRSGYGTFPYSERITFTVRQSDQNYATKVAGRLVGRSPANICGKHARASLTRDRVTGYRM
jgi:hypothetical protein